MLRKTKKPANRKQAKTDLAMEMCRMIGSHPGDGGDCHPLRVLERLVRDHALLVPAPSPQGMTDAFSAITEPTIVKRATETIGYLDELEGVSGAIQKKLFFACPPTVYAAPDSLEEMLALICTRTACLVGFLQTINGKL
jgi:hypothetical protein